MCRLGSEEGDEVTSACDYLAATFEASHQVSWASWITKGLQQVPKALRLVHQLLWIGIKPHAT